MPESCDKCSALERQLRNVKDSIDAEIGKRERGFATSDEDLESNSSLAKLFKSLTQTELLYDRHRLRAHSRARPEDPR
jgi:hypothetical protein